MTEQLHNRYASWAKLNVRPSAQVRDRDGVFDRGLWQALAREEFFKLLAPQERGGVGATPRQFASAFRGLAFGSLDIPWVLSVGAHAGVATSLLLAFGSSEQIDRYLPGFIDGSCIAGVSNSEPGAGTDLRAMRSQILPEHEDAFRGTIRKSAANNIGVGDLAITSAQKLRPDGKISFEVFLLDLAQATERAQLSLGGFRTGDVGSLHFEDFAVDCAACQLGGDGSGSLVLRRCFDLERLLLGELIAGTLGALLELAVSYAWQRQSAGRRLAEHQYIQEKVCIIFSAHECIDALLGRLWEEGNTRFPSNNARLSHLKFVAVEKGLAAAQAYLELCGMSGYQSDNPAQKLMRDLLGLLALGGTKELHKITLFDAISEAAGFRPCRELSDG
ncbi:MAG: acyl-CoA dehydrogenase family protein [Bdellovibrionota bacterium]